MKRHLSKSEVETLNARTGAVQTVRVLDTIIVPTNIVLAVVGLLLFVARTASPGSVTLPAFFEPYEIGLTSAIAAAYMVFLNHAYNGYFDTYSRATLLTGVGGAIDVFVKVGLLAGSVLVVAEPQALVALTLFLYLVDALRLYELRSPVPKSNPIHGPLVRYWIPNNWRHNRRLALLLLTQVAVQLGWIYTVAGWVTPGLELPDGDDLAPVTSGILNVFLIWFAVYWVIRMLTKTIPIPHQIFNQLTLKQLDDILERYYGD